MHLIMLSSSISSHLQCAAFDSLNNIYQLLRRTLERRGLFVAQLKIRVWVKHVFPLLKLYGINFP